MALPPRYPRAARAGGTALALLLILLLLGVVSVGGARADEGPLLAIPPEAAGEQPALAGGTLASLSVNPSDRAAAVQFFRSQYVMTSQPAHGWSGSVASCTPGSTSAEFQAAVVRRINYFRAMAGVPAAITLDATMSARAQAAALMMSANNSLNHAPPTTWRCYSELGKTGAGSSNLALGSFGWNAIDLYIRDPGPGNEPVGHRRWILHPPTRAMGTGDVPGGAGQAAANALAVFNGPPGDSAPVLREPEGFVAWPPRGFVPHSVVYPRWSFSLAGANFSNATVSMRRGDGAAVTVTRHPPQNGYGLNTLVWEPAPASSGFTGAAPTADLPFEITIGNVVVNGQSRSYSYRVTIINVDAQPQPSPNQPPVDLALAPTTLAENAPGGSLAGTLSARDPENAGPISYALVAGEGDGDNQLFAITGATIVTRGSLDFEARSGYSVRVAARDQGGAMLSRAFTIAISDANDPPTIETGALFATPGQPFTVTLRARDQDSGDAVTLAVEGLPAWLTLVDNGDGTLTLRGMAPAERGASSFTLTASDRAGATTSRSVRLLVGASQLFLPLTRR